MPQVPEISFFEFANSTTDAILILDESGNTVYLNDSASGLLGYSAGELSNAALKSFSPGWNSGEQNISVPLNFKTKSGNQIQLQATFTKLTSSEKEYLCAVLRDVRRKEVIEEDFRRSEERLHIVALATNDVIWEWQLKEDKIWWNEGMTRLFGYAPKEIGTDTIWWSEKLHPEDREVTVNSLYSAVKRNDQTWTAEYRFKRADGTYAWVLDRGYVVAQDEGNPSRMTGAMMDITIQKRAQHEFIEAQRKYRMLIERLPTIIYKANFDPAFAWSYVSPQIEKILGFTPQYWMTHSGIWMKQIHPDDLERVMQAESQSQRTGEPLRVEYRIYSREGRLLWFRDEAVVEYDENGKATWLSGVILDITERIVSERALINSEERYRSLIKQSSEGIFIFDPFTKRIQEANLKMLEMLGYTEEELTEKTIYDIIRADKESIDTNVETTLRTGQIHIAVRQYKRKDGTPVDVEISGSLISYGQSRVILVNVTDVSERKRAEQLQSALYRVAQVTASAVDLENFYHAIHSIVAELMYAENFYLALYDQPTNMLSFPYFVDQVDKNPPATQPLSPGLTAYVLRTGEPMLITREKFDQLIKEGEVEFFGGDSVDWLGVPLRAGGKIFGVLVVQSYDPLVRYGEREKEVLTFVSQHIASALERKRSEETIKHQAYHDPLTHLPNRMLFRDRFAQALARARRNKEILAMMFMDLDRFKMINDTLGHVAGDRLLQIVGERLKANIRQGDTIARLGGDEFMLLISVKSVEDVAKVAEKILDAVRPSLALETQEIHVTTSIGISLYPYDGEDPDTLVKHADIALYRAKEHGRDNYQMFTPAMNARALELLETENRLRRALERQEFTLHFQPIVKLVSGEVTSVEALVRWKGADRHLIYPDQFIPMAEDNGLIVSLGEWVLRNACVQVGRWRRENQQNVGVAVNLSARQFQQKDLVVMISNILEETVFPPECLELELTESTVMKNAEQAIETLRSLKKMGIRISIDDFGTGYSSLSYLRQLPIDTLKIDQSFVRHSADNSDGLSIVAAIISLAHNLKLKVVAEGVETEAQLGILRDLKCDYVQGFLIGMPQPAHHPSFTTQNTLPGK